MRKRELERKLEQLEEMYERQDTVHELELREATAFQRTLAQEQKDGGFQSLDASATKRNRTWSDVEKNLKDVYAAWAVNPYAKSFIDYSRFFVVGKGTQVTTEEGKDAESRIKMFLDLNDWALLEKCMCEELSRDGELFVRFHETNRMDMQSSVAAISLVDPLEIQLVDIEEINKPKRYLRVWSEPGEMDDSGNFSVESKRDWIDASEIEHIKINTSHNETRGRSDLLVMLPWLLQLKRWIDDMSRRNYLSGAVNWDVTTSGAITPSTVTAKYPTGPMPGSVLAHTDAEVWKVNSPDMKWGDSTTGARFIKLVFCAAAKQPESWYGDTGESNLATTQALSMPTLKAFADRQDTLGYWFKKIISRGARVENVEVQFPEIVAEEMDKKATALKSLSEAITNLQTAGVLSRESAYEIVRQYVDTLDAWADDESGVGEKHKIDTEDTEEAVAVAQGRKSGATPERPELMGEFVAPAPG